MYIVNVNEWVLYMIDIWFKNILNVDWGEEGLRERTEGIGWQD
jgi:hypothetical protein